VVTRIIIIILSIIIIVGWKPILYWLFGPKNQTLSGISLAKRSRSGPNSLYLDRSRGDNVQGILGAIGPFWPKWGLGRVPQSRSFFCLVNHTLFRQLCNGRFSPNVVTKRSSVSRCRIRKDLFEKFYFMGHLPPKSEIELGSNRHLTQEQATGHGMHCREMLFTPRCSPRAREFPRSGQLFCMMYGCDVPYDVRLWSYGPSKLPNFWILAYFPHTNTLKRTFRWPACSPGVTLQNDYDSSMW